MGYSGQTFRVPFHVGGFNYNANVDNVPPEGMLLCRNIDLQDGGRASRGGTAKINGSALSGTPSGRGGFDFQLGASTSFQVFATSDGKLWKNTTTTIKTGLSTTNPFSFDVFGNELYICDGDTTPQTWDGSAGATSNLTTPAADWSGGNQPFQVIAHGRGASRRMFYLYSNAVYYSSLANGKVVSGGTSGKITIDTGDAIGLVGGFEFGNRLIVFSKKKAFIIDDDNADPTLWGYEAVQWSGGVGHWRLIVKTPNDCIVMAEDGEIYSISAVFQYGDYKAASLARPAFVHRWIKENVRLSYIESFHGCFDPVQRCVRFWVVTSANTQCDTCLKFYVDRPVDQAWAIDDAVDNASGSGMRASMSFPVRESVGVWKVYTFDYAGFLWSLGTSNKDDDGHAYYAGFKIPYLTFDNPRIRKNFRRGFITTQPEGNYSLSVKVFVDGVYKDTKLISLATDASVFGSAIFGTDTFAGSELIEAKFDLGYFGKRIQLEFFTNGVNEDFFVSQTLIDFKSTGARIAA